MTDYIKREDAIEQARRNWIGEGEWIASTEIQLLKNLPSADVIEVVRCKDCIHYDNCDKEIDIVNNGEVHITRIMEWCSHGERNEA